MGDWGDKQVRDIVLLLDARGVVIPPIIYEDVSDAMAKLIRERCVSREAYDRLKSRLVTALGLLARAIPS